MNYYATVIRAYSFGYYGVPLNWWRFIYYSNPSSAHQAMRERSSGIWNGPYDRTPWKQMPIQTQWKFEIGNIVEVIAHEGTDAIVRSKHIDEAMPSPRQWNVTNDIVGFLTYNPRGYHFNVPILTDGPEVKIPLDHIEVAEEAYMMDYLKGIPLEIREQRWIKHATDEEVEDWINGR